MVFGHIMHAVDLDFVEWETPQVVECREAGSEIIKRSLDPGADLADELNMRSVAEGAETPADLAAVRLAGYDEAQGFDSSLPVRARAGQSNNCSMCCEVRRTRVSIKQHE